MPDGPPDGLPGDPHERLVTIVHDLRTPLAIVDGFVDIVRRRGDELSDEQREDYLRRIAEAAGEMRRILDLERADRLA